MLYACLIGLPLWFSNKESNYNAGDAAEAVGSVPEMGRSSGEGNNNLLQYSCLENFIDKGAWQATVCGVAKESDMISNWKMRKQHHHVYLK